MPFDALPEKLVSDLVRLRIARDGIKTRWHQGTLGLDVAAPHCLVGWLLVAAEGNDEEAARLAVDYVYPSLPERVRAKSRARSRIETIFRFNDYGPPNKHKQVLAVMDAAIRRAEQA